MVLLNLLLMISNLHVDTYIVVTVLGVFLLFQASIRRNASYLIGYLFKNSKLYLVDEAPNMISTLIILLSDTDLQTVSVGLLLFQYLKLNAHF